MASASTGPITEVSEGKRPILPQVHDCQVALLDLVEKRTRQRNVEGSR